MPQLDEDERPLARGEALFWQRGAKSAWHVRTIRPHAEHLRHRKKYAEGDLGADASFYFRGPDKRLNLRAQNLNLLLQIADGVDDQTWLHHLRADDFSRWLGENIKDDGLAAEVAEIENDQALNAVESRARIRAAVTRRYTALA